MSFLGIDLGTGGIRCLLIDDNGKILADLSRPLVDINLSDVPGHSEQNPVEWLTLLEDVLSELFSQPMARAVRAIAVDSTSGTVLPVNRQGIPWEMPSCTTIFGRAKKLCNAKKFLADLARPLFLSLRFYGCNRILD